MKKALQIFLFITALIFICELVYGQTPPPWQWAKASSGVGTHYAGDIAVDSIGNSIITGAIGGTSSTIIFDSLSLIFSALGNGNYFIAKHNASGNALWLKGADNAVGRGVCIDANGNYYTTGGFGINGTVFDTIGLFSYGSGDIFVAKYDSAGNLIWAKGFGGTGSEDALSIGADTYGYIYVTGYFRSPSIAFDSVNIITNASSSEDFFIVKLDSMGNVAWAKSAGGLPDDFGVSLTTDASGNIFASGSFGGDSITFDSITLYKIPFSSSAFIVKYNPSGNVIWAKCIGANAATIDNAITIACETNGNLYITGSFTSPTITFDSIILINSTATYKKDVFIAKYNASGNVLWAKGAGGATDDESNHIAVDKNGDAFITGNFKSPTITFDGITLNNAGQQNTFVTKYDGSGNALWAKCPTVSVYSNGMAVDLDASSNLYLAGWHGYQGALFDSITLPATGSNQVNLSKISCITTSTITVTACNAYTSPSGNYNWTNSGVYNDTIPNASGCDSVITINLTINTVDTSVTANAPNLSANATVATYQWMYCDSSLIMGATNQSYTATANGSYAIIVSQNGCTDTSSCYLVLNVGIDEMENESALMVYPNPVHDVLIVSLKKPLHSYDVITISDMQGRVIKEEIITKNNNKDTSIDVTTFSQGVYLLKVNENVHRFVKM